MKVIKNISIIFWQNPQYTMPLLILLWGIYYFFYGAIINYNDGLGFDGTFYGNLVKNFYEQLFDNKLSFYYIQRIFPSFLINLVLSIANLPKENYIIVRAFQLYNLILLLLCTQIWYRISSINKFNLKLIWVGFILGFINYGNVGITFFDPVLTDTTAFFLGFLLLYFYLTNNLPGKIIVMILGAFTWPSFIYFSILLIIFPKNFKINFDLINSNPSKLRNKFLTFLLPLPFFLIAVYNISKYLLLDMNNEYFFRDEIAQTESAQTQNIPSFLYISAVLNFLLLSYFFIIFLPINTAFAKYFQFLKEMITNIKIKHFLISLFLFIIIHSVQKYLSNDIQVISLSLTIYHISLYSCSKPFSYIVTSITYFGPCFILLFVYLKNYKSALKNVGVGIYVSFILSFIMLFDTEVRKIINLFPIIILISVLVLKDLNLQNTLFLLLLIFSFLLSKVYIPMFNIPNLHLDLFEFPNQLFFMNTYMISNVSYYIHLPIIILMIVSILSIIKKNNNQIDAR